MKLKKLTLKEKRVIVDKGTEKPFAGEYDNFYVEGHYECRRCGALLYRSQDKFDAHCGWPAFDDAVLGAVTRNTDADEKRTEISCRRCGAHLGHVFEGEQLTDKNVRHCVNSLSMRFVPADESLTHLKKAYFGSGCFWCTQAAFKMVKGVQKVTAGYAGGQSKNPTYEAVSFGDTHHAEVVEIVYDETQIAYEALLEIFFTMHDPTTPNRQGVDVGEQYRSIILYQTELEKELAEKFIAELEMEKVFAAKIVTEIKRLEKFYPAEKYHQNYFQKNPQEVYCQMTIAPKLEKLRKQITQYFIS